MEEKIYNKRTHRWVTVNGIQYKKLLKEGYRINEKDQLSPPRPITDTKVFDNPVLLSNLEPKDLLALYTTSKTIKKMIDQSNIIRLLNQKYNTVSNTFMDWYKAYQYQLLNADILYLYQLENTRFINNDQINEKIVMFTMDWMYNQAKVLKLNNNWITSYAINLLLIYISMTNIKNEDLPLYATLSLYYATLILMENGLELYDCKKIAGVKMTQLTDASIKMFNDLNGQLIYPSSMAFSINYSKNVSDLTRLTQFDLSLSIYKPSLIAETCQYIVHGKFNIYSEKEVSTVCQKIVAFINKVKNSSLKNLNDLANNVQLNYTCGKEITELSIQPLNYNEEWHLGEVEKLNKIGEGGYAVVKKVKRKQCGKEYAIKKSEGVTQSEQLEITVLKLLSNKPYVISLCGFELNNSNIKIILPLLSGSIDKIKINQSKIGRYFKQILLGVQSIHSCDIMHRDMKTSNIVYDQVNDEMLIIDFGICVPFESFKLTDDVSMAATISFRAPEALLGHIYDKKIDIWAVGCIFYFMITRQYIVSTDTYDEKILLNEIFKLRGTPNEKTWAGISQYLSRFPIYQPQDLSYLGIYANLIADCLTLNPKNRPTATELLSKYF